MSPLNVIHANATHCIFQQFGKSALPKKKADLDRTKVSVDHKTLSEGHERRDIYCHAAFIEIDTDFHQLREKTDALVG